MKYLKYLLISILAMILTVMIRVAITPKKADSTIVIIEEPIKPLHIINPIGEAHEIPSTDSN